MFPLTLILMTRYNTLCAEVAQQVEQRTENPCVPSSILGLGTLPETQSRFYSVRRSGGIGRRDSLKNC